MSEGLRRNTTLASNEEVIDELTKDLKSSLNTDENIEEFVISPGSRADDFPSASEDTSKITDDPTHTKTDVSFLDNDETEYEKDHDKESCNDDSDTDIDEESLKDVEVDLTDDQKEERRIIAEELKTAGNEAFKTGEYERSIEKYTEGLRICPLQFAQQRSVLYCNRSAAKMKLEKYAKAVKDCTKAIELDEKYLKAYIRRAQSYEATDKLDEALSDYKKILEFDPSHKEAQKAVVRLPPIIEEKNEKLKTEMLSKLKDLGNMILKPFGLSTDNFQMEQDPETKEIMPRCRRRRKMCRTRCRSRSGRFKRCRSRDRRYRVLQRCCRRRRTCGRRRRRRSRCGRKRRYLWRCRSRSGSFKRCRHCDRRYKIRRRSRS